MQKKRSERVGERVYQKSLGIYGEITRYGGYNDIMVALDDGSVRETRYDHFRKGEIGQGDNEEKRIRAKERYEGCIFKNTDGFEMVVTRYENKDNVIVRFSKGALVETSTAQLARGNVKTPCDEFVGLKNIATNGQEMEICGMRSKTDLDVRFEDGTVVARKRYDSFLSGEIGNPNFTSDDRKRCAHLGKEKVMNCGLTATVVGVSSYPVLTVAFEDGVKIQTQYSNFRTGRCCHPDLNPKNSDRNFYGYRMLGRGPVTKIGNMVFFRFERLSDGEVFILTPQQILEMAREKGEIPQVPPQTKESKVGQIPSAENEIER